MLRLGRELRYEVASACTALPRLPLAEKGPSGVTSEGGLGGDTEPACSAFVASSSTRLNCQGHMTL